MSSPTAQALTANYKSVPSQWLNDVNEKVVLANGDPVPVVLLANKVRKKINSPRFPLQSPPF
jgi:hypothetical protein